MASVPLLQQYSSWRKSQIDSPRRKSGTKMPTGPGLGFKKRLPGKNMSSLSVFFWAAFCTQDLKNTEKGSEKVPFKRFGNGFGRFRSAFAFANDQEPKRHMNMNY
eukprot:6477252-Amphidinium_carterae.1